jgi:hypothetical protein
VFVDVPSEKISYCNLIGIFVRWFRWYGYHANLVLILSRCGFENVGDRVVNPASGKLSRQPKTVPEATTEFIHSVLKGTLYLHDQGR